MYIAFNGLVNTTTVEVKVFSRLETKNHRNILAINFDRSTALSSA
ncbi:Uncharacterised protein [Klebsiella pneumoniae]|nr:Uncharacterised protein [Klebsiella pneumoniae]